MSPPNNADAWGLDKVLEFFDHNRATTTDVYASEWHFLEGALTEGISVLDVGCAKGGFAGILAEHLSEFSYTGLDINPDMIASARERYPDHEFHTVPEGDFSVLGARRFDLVLVLGILHLHEAWRDTVAQSWRHTGGLMILDLRETEGESVEDKTRSYFRMDFHGGGPNHTDATLPYNIINQDDAARALDETCPGAASRERFAYRHAVSGSAVTPIPEVMAAVYAIRRSA